MPFLIACAIAFMTKEPIMHRVHYFDTSEEAFDACLSEAPSIEAGDVVAILPESVIGLVSTDPIAITDEAGSLRHSPPMPMATMLEELAHDVTQLRHAVETALLHHLPVQPHFLAFGKPEKLFPLAQTVVALTLDDIMVIIDALDCRAALLNGRLKHLSSGTLHSFIAREIDELTDCRRRLLMLPCGKS